MTEAATSSAEAEAEVHAIAQALAGSPVDAMKRVGGGRNSRVFRVDCAGAVYALKQYPSRADDPRDRLGTEAAALRWMEYHGLAMVPRLVAVDPDRNFSLLSWAGGEMVRAVGEDDVDQAAAFLAELHARRTTPAIPTDHLATEACLSGAEIERQMRARLANLAAIAEERALAAFLAHDFAPRLEAALIAAKAAMAEAGLSFTDELAQEKRSLVPSDFGFHNALRNSHGRLTFIDFEYFGWDDPVKLTADVMLHPGTPVSPTLRRRFGAAATRLYANDPDFTLRLTVYQPLFGLRWVLILLNEFHPERWRRRILAGETQAWTDAKMRQLTAASEMLESLSIERSDR